MDRRNNGVVAVADMKASTRSFNTAQREKSQQ